MIARRESDSTVMLGLALLTLAFLTGAAAASVFFVLLFFGGK